MPGAVHEPPTWLLKDAPFDMAAYFKEPAPDDNAAPLYLDAFFEFSDVVSPCFPEPDRSQRILLGKKRYDMISELSTRMADKPSGLSPAEVEGLMNELHDGFQKLSTAQSRPACVFASAVDLGALLWHAHASRNIVRAIKLKTWHELSRGNVDAALSSVETALRLSRDLRPRGASVCQLVSIACDGVIFQQIIPEILAQAELTVAQCDRLLASLKEHAGGHDPLTEAFKADYVRTRILLHNAEHNTGIFDSRYLRETFGADGDPVDVIVDLSMATGDKSDWKRRLKAEIETMTSVDYRKRTNTLNQYYRALARVAAGLAQSTDEDFMRLDKILEEQSLFLSISQGEATALSRAARRHRALQSGTTCLVALRRWSINSDAQPDDLESVVRAAGLANVPIDPFDGRLLRMTRLNGVPVIYSVGFDRRDDSAKQEWKGNPGEPAGDILFAATWK